MAWKEHEVKEMRCTSCGESMMGTTKRKMCSGCRRKMEAAGKKRRDEQKKLKKADRVIPEKRLSGSPAAENHRTKLRRFWNGK